MKRVVSKVGAADFVGVDCKDDIVKIRFAIRGRISSTSYYCDGNNNLAKTISTA